MSLSREQQIRRAQDRLVTPSPGRLTTAPNPESLTAAPSTERLVAPTPDRPTAAPKPDQAVIPESAINMLTQYVAARIPEARKDPIRNCTELMKLIEVAEWLLEREGA